MEPVFFSFFILENYGKIYVKSTLKLKNILDPEGQVFSLNKKTNLFGKHKPRTYSPL